MTTTQLLILVIPIIAALLISGYLFFNREENTQRPFLYIIFLFCFVLISVVAIISTANYLDIKAKMKCPEYEKVENVYKLKE